VIVPPSLATLAQMFLHAKLTNHYCPIQSIEFVVQNGTRSTIDQLVSKLNSIEIPKNVDVAVAPTFIHLDYVRNKIKPEYIISAQNCSVGQGAYTGEIAADQLTDAGYKWTILGHSERRSLFGATDDVVAKQVKAALAAGLNVIACCGETIDERKADKTLEVVTRQLNAIAASVGNNWDRIVIAYEPVWSVNQLHTFY
jgi:triosephosphate isomerase